MRPPSLPTVRRGLQLGVAVVMALVPLANARGLNLINGNLLALEAFGIPLGDPLAAAQVLASARGIGLAGALGALAALVLALVLGPVFCAYACPYGLLSEWVHGLARPVPGGRRAPGRERGGFALRLGLTAAGLLAIGGLGLPPLLDLLSLPAAYSRVWQYAVLGGLFAPAAAIPVLLLVEGLTGRRLWCRFACPQSVLLVLVRRLAPWGLRVGFEASRCRCAPQKPRCVAACQLGLDPRRDRGWPLTCTNCGDCVTACRHSGGALAFRLGPGDARRAGPGDSTTPEARV